METKIRVTNIGRFIRLNENSWINIKAITFIYKCANGKTVIEYLRSGGCEEDSNTNTDLTIDEVFQLIDGMIG